MEYEKLTKTKPIPKFCPTIGELPTSYLMSMTYLEQITWICNHITKEIIPKINANSELTNSLINDVENVNQELIAIKDYVDNYLKDIDEIKEEIIVINDTLRILNDGINLTNERITNVKNELEDLIRSNYNTLKLYVDSQDDILNEKIDNIQIGAISVYNPTNGLIQPLQYVINDLYEISNKDGLTCSEFDSLDLTATSFDSYQITAYEFDSQGKIILV